MEITTVQLKRCTLIRVSGRVDSTVVPELEAALDKLLAANHHKLVLNMAEVTYLSSAGLRALYASLEGMSPPSWRRPAPGRSAPRSRAGPRARRLAAQPDHLRDRIRGSGRFLKSLLA